MAFEADERFDADGLGVNAVSLPAAIAVAWLLDVTRLWFVLGYLFQTTYHELGHATVAWLSGRFAMPLPIGLTSIANDRSTALIVLVLAALVAGLALAVRARRLDAIALAAGLIALEVALSFVTSPGESRTWCIFGGCAGELVLPALAAASFYAELPDRARWDFWRWPFFFVAICALLHAHRMWLHVAADTSKLPRGTAIEGSGDSNGDMNRLLRAGWTPLGIASAYLGIADVAWVALAALYSFRVVRSLIRDRVR